jgi:hypothetical protein
MKEEETEVTKRTTKFSLLVIGQNIRSKDRKSSISKDLLLVSNQFVL